MITLIYQLHNLRVAIPAAIMLGSSTTFISLWTPFRVLTSILPKSLFVWGDDRWFSLYQRLVLFFFEHFTGAQIYLYGDAKEVLQKQENVVYISNHQSTLDWVVSEMLAVRQGSLGHVRYILKDGLRFFPMYGFYFRQHSCIYVSRNKTFNEARAVSQLEELRELPFWLVIFPEGTRFNPDSAAAIDRSQQFAKDNGLPILDQVLTPRTKAAWLSLSTLREKCDALYDVTIAYSDTVDSEGRRKQSPGLPDFLHRRSTQKIHIHVKRHSISDICLKDEASFRLWLAQRFQEKDRLMKRFYDAKNDEEQTFGDDGSLSPLPLHHTFPAFVFWMSALAPFVLTSSGRTWYCRIGLSATGLGALWMMIRK